MHEREPPRQARAAWVLTGAGAKARWSGQCRGRRRPHRATPSVGCPEALPLGGQDRGGRDRAARVVRGGRRGVDHSGGARGRAGPICTGDGIEATGWRRARRRRSREPPIAINRREPPPPSGRDVAVEGRSSSGRRARPARRQEPGRRVTSVPWTNRPAAWEGCAQASAAELAGHDRARTGPRPVPAADAIRGRRCPVRRS
jgi:hypothetical protein